MGLFGRKKQNTENMPETVEKAVAEVSAESTNPGDMSLGGDRMVCRHQLDHALSGDGQGVVMKFYIENFKRMNELFGFSYCEELLKAILEYLREKTGCTVYRYVGVEFIAILRSRTQGQAVRLAEEILDRFSQSWKIDGTDCMCSCQIGLCSYPGYASSADEILKYLDLAVSKAAETGINQYAIYDSKLHAMYLRKQAIARYISTALENHELEIRFRPTYNTKENRFVRAEYYMRMFVKDIGLVGSAEFVPIAEDTGQISSVEYYALERVAQEIAELEKKGIAYESIAVPVSPVLIIQENFVDTVQRMIEKYQIPSGKLAVEIDEYALTTTPVIIEIVMQQLKDLGVELILNNFGSGYSGISKILELPVDTLKFERMFMWQLETNPKSEPIVECLIKAADKLGKRLIAEGVETQRQLDILAKFGCEYQQGYYYAPTIPQELLDGVLGKSMDETRAVLNQEREKLKR
ncbi:MAG: EAL domain-containing protein [Clostridium sp.]|mgnify:FL=1